VKRLRHRPPHLRLLGLGRRALFGLVGHRPAADDRHRAENFERAFLAGAHAMDQHFRSAPLGEPAGAAGLLGVWHRNVWGYPSRAVLPYDQRLSRFPPICSSSTWNRTASA
jgi:glucose-6-phosphate isomerase